MGATIGFSVTDLLSPISPSMPGKMAVFQEQQGKSRLQACTDK